MTRSERLIAIVQSMQTRRTSITAAQLAEEFDVSERTIYRDVAVLEGRGAIIEGERGLGFVIRPGHFLPPLMFDAEEADALALGLRFAIGRSDPNPAKAARSALAKLEAIVPTPMEIAKRNGLAPLPEAAASAETLRLIRDGIRRERKLEFTYRGERGRTSSRRVCPVAVGFFANGEMLAAWCETRAAFRHFRLDRMIDVVASAERMLRAHRILLADYRRQEP